MIVALSFLVTKPVNRRFVSRLVDGAELRAEELRKHFPFQTRLCIILYFIRI
jgi:hypothetical protein